MQPKQNSLHMSILTHWQQNDRHFANDISKCIFLNENVWISIEISPFVSHSKSSPWPKHPYCRNDTTKKFINWLAPWRCHNNYKNIIFKVIIQRSNSSPPFEIAPIWMPQHLTNAKSALLQVMATNQYMSKCWSRLIVRRGGLIWSHEDPEMWWSVPFTCAWLYMSFFLFCLICVYSSQFSILFELCAYCNILDIYLL